MKIKLPKTELNLSTLKLTGIIFILFIVSCGSDDSDPENSIDFETEILGTWNLVSHISLRTVSETGTSTSENGSNYDYTVEFTDNPKFINTNGNYTVNVEETNNQNQTSTFSYVINSNENQQEGFHIGEWRISGGNLLTRVYDIEPNDPGSYELTTEIIELTSNRLVLKTDDSASSSDNFTVMGNTTLIYER